MTRRAVYTALLGSYEALNEAQVSTPGIDFVCFTDDASLRSERWRVVVVEPEFARDPHRSQRRLKILGHPELGAYDETLYIDNSVSLTGDPGEILDEWLAEADMGLARHSYRDSVAEEFAAVIASALDDHHRVAEQWDHYVDTIPHVINGPVLWGGMIARRRSDQVADACSTWFHHVLRYSRRDQLSLPAALDAHGVRPHISVMSNRLSQWHAWPVEVGRRF